MDREGGGGGEMKGGICSNERRKGVRNERDARKGTHVIALAAAVILLQTDPHLLQHAIHT